MKIFMKHLVLQKPLPKVPRYQSEEIAPSASPCLDLTDDSASSVRNGRDGKQRCLEEQHNNVT